MRAGAERRGAPQAARSAPTDEARARKSLEKTGDTPFLTREVTVDTDGAWMLPASALNAMRREALEKLLALRETPRAHRIAAAIFFIIPFRHLQKPGLCITALPRALAACLRRRSII